MPEGAFLSRLAQMDVSDLLDNGRGLSLEWLDNTREVSAGKIPLVVSDGRRGKASMVSPSAHYVDYPLLEMGRARGAASRLALAAAAVPWRAFFAATALDKVVYVNHTLMSACRPLSSSHSELARIIDALETRFPEHAISFQGVVPALAPEYRRMLVSLGGRDVQSRVIHLLDTRVPLDGGTRKRVRQTRSTDRRIYEARLRDRVTDRDRLVKYSRRIKFLYDGLYLKKYSYLNPQYTEAFFRALIESGDFSCAAWFDGEELEAFNIKLIHGGINHWSVCGYNCDSKQRKTLFRLIAAEDFLGSDGDLMVNWGGGNSPFKKFRGALQALEYEVVFDSHLPRRRRAPWTALREIRGARHPVDALSPSIPKPRVQPAGRQQPGTLRKIAIVTSLPNLIAPFFETDLHAIGVEVPAVALIAGTSLLWNRVSELPAILKRQSRINKTNPVLQLINRVVYYRAAERRDESAAAVETAAAIETIASNRMIVEAASANDERVLAAIRDSGCEMCIVLGADILSRATIASLSVPLFNLHLSDPGFMRGMPPVFWEILDDRDAITLTLHRLTAELDSGAMISQRDVAISWRDSLPATISATRAAAAAVIAQLLREAVPAILAGTASEKPGGKGPLRTVPKFPEVLRARAICARRSGSTVVRT